MRLEIAEYGPDASPLAGASARMLNCLPRSAGSCGPMPSPSPVGAALGGRCQGAAAAVDAAGNVSLYAGDAGSLRGMTGSAVAFADLSRPGGYHTAAEQRWVGTQFGDLVVMTNFADPIQSCRIGAGTPFADLSPAAPRARVVAVVRDWLVAGGTLDPAFGNRPQRVWWSAIDDPAGWPAPGTSDAVARQSDYQDLVGDGGWVQAIVGNLGSADGVVFQERAIWRMQYVGPPAIFAFSVVETARGTPAPGSVAAVGGTAFYLGEDGFYAFDGLRSRPIGAGRVDRSFFADLDQAHMDRIVAAADPIARVCFWAYPGAGNVGGNPNRLIAYNWAVDRFSLVEATVETIFRALSAGASLDALDRLGLPLEEVPASLDSRLWTGGRLVLAGFDDRHRLVWFTGPPLAAEVETMEIGYVDDGSVLVRAARPLVDAAGASVAIGTRNRTADRPVFAAARAVDARGSTPQRSTGRYIRARISLPAGTRFEHIAGVEIDAVPAGRR